MKNMLTIHSVDGMMCIVNVEEKDISTYDEDRANYVSSNRDKFAHYAAKQRDKLKLEMIEAYGGSCQHCGESDPIVLALDHIADDSHVEKDLYGTNARGGHKQYSRLKQEGWPKERFQLLCFNCNAKKEHIRRRKLIGDRWGEEKPADRVLVQARIGLRKHNSSGIKGVFWNSQKKKWQAQIMLNYTKHYLGAFDSLKDAAMAYRAAALDAWGAEANLQTDEEINEAVARESSRAPIAIPDSLEDLGL